MRSAATTTTTTTDVFDNEIVPSALASISPILRVANEIETDRPRVAYLCRFYASEKAHRLDPSSSGCGVSQFKTLLLQELERDKASSLSSLVKETDTREIESFYHQYYEDNVRAVDQGEQLQADRAQLGKPYQTAGVLFEVLCAVKKTENVELCVLHFKNDINSKLVKIDRNGGEVFSNWLAKIAFYLL